MAKRKAPVTAWEVMAAPDEVVDWGFLLRLAWIGVVLGAAIAIA